MDLHAPQQHLLFVWKPSGYELVVQDGEPPAVGSQVELDGNMLEVTKLAPSPLPGDRRVCAYLGA
ncbi:MAG TPA: hypothetical protein VFJ11_11605 [Gaiellaceae bacterium]|nr:hypothetical protein [Gaiellaceae bacterium]